MSRTDHTPTDAMAQWLATGGALDAAANAEGGRDGGLQASSSSMHGFCHTDEGLQASLPTMRGLCHADDGLTAQGPTGGRNCYTDDTLQAGGISIRVPCGDDGLQAGGYSISFCPVMAPTPTPAP
jgi:hypothetical protein